MARPLALVVLVGMILAVLYVALETEHQSAQVPSAKGANSESDEDPALRRVILSNPPNDDCDALLESSLLALQQASEAVAGSLAKPGRPALQEVDAQWLSIPRGPKFLHSFLSFPPGVATQNLHRCPDLNPEDIYISPELRAGLEAALGRYVSAMEQISARQDQALKSAVAVGDAKMSHVVPVMPAGPADSSVSLLIPAASGGDSGTVTTIERVGESLMRKDIAPGLLEEYHFLNALYWYAARELGCQIITVYGGLGLLPSLAAEDMKRTICAVCGSRSQ